MGVRVGEGKRGRRGDGEGKPSRGVATGEKLPANVKSFKKAPPDVTGELLLNQLETGGGKERNQIIKQIRMKNQGEGKETGRK